MNTYFTSRLKNQRCNFVWHLKILILGISIIFLLNGCNEQHNIDSRKGKINSGNLAVSDTIRKSIKKIKEHRILFAHHSVGENIIGGLKDIAKEAGVDFKVDHLTNISVTNKNNFFDFSPGNNRHPKTKIDGFVNKIENLDSKYILDIAFMKFCYIDFLQETDINDVFTHYKKNIMMLKNKKPDITFVHLTVPLMARSYDIKARIKRLLGKEHWIDVTNVQRAKFNDLLLKTFPNDQVFDIARIESTRMNGSRVAASKMVVFLAGTLSKKSKTN